HGARSASEDDLSRRHQARARARESQARSPPRPRAAASLPPARGPARRCDALDRSVPPLLGGPLRSIVLAPRGDEVRAAIAFAPPLNVSAAVIQSSLARTTP